MVAEAYSQLAFKASNSNGRLIHVATSQKEYAMDNGAPAHYKSRCEHFGVSRTFEWDPDIPNKFA